MGYSVATGVRRSRYTSCWIRGMQMVPASWMWAVALAAGVFVTAAAQDVEETVYEAIGRQGDLTQFRDLVNEDEVLRKMLQHWSVTLFAPTDEAFENNADWIDSTDVKIISYHVLNLVANKSSFPLAAATSLSGAPPVYLGIKSPHHSERKEYFANNAKIIRAESYRSNEGAEQLLYVIDDVLRPYRSRPFLPKDALKIVQEPESYNLPFSVRTFSSKLREENLEHLFEREGNHTFFIPIDTVQDGRIKQQMDSWVIRGHIIPKNVIFTRLAGQDVYASDAFDDNIHVELSFINKSMPDGSHEMYAQSNTLFSNYGQRKGVVISKIVRGNIPVKNGVVHFIERPLIVVNVSIWEFIDSEQDSRLVEFRRLLNHAPDFKDMLMSDREKTLFAPSNDAIRQIPFEILDPVKRNATAISELLKLHLVMSSISSDDVFFDRRLECIPVDNCNSLKLRVVGNEHNKTLVVEGKVVKATAIQSDIGAVDGIVHIVDRLLGVPYQTVYDRLQADLDLRITYDLGEQDGWGEMLDKHGKQYTFFAPSNEAWAHVRHHMPTEYKQLTMGAIPYHVHKILDRHLVINKVILLDNTEEHMNVQMVHGVFKIHKEVKHGKAGYVVEWEGLKADVVQPNVKSINGVIHVIDRVMMKKRDLTKSEASSSFQSPSNLFLSILVYFVVSKSL